MIIHYLASPTCAFCRHVEAMITTIAQQTGTEFRHYEEIGLMPEPARSAVISERSLRYTEADLCFYRPLYYDAGQYEETTTAAARSYNEALENIPKERARIILPTSLFSFAFFTINLRNLFNLLRQRAAPSAQPETRFIAERMQAEAARMYPLSMAAYEEAYPKAGPS